MAVDAHVVDRKTLRPMRGWQKVMRGAAQMAGGYLYILDAISAPLALVDRERRSMYDFIAGTVVVIGICPRKRRRRPAGAGWRNWAGFCGGGRPATPGSRPEPHPGPRPPGALRPGETAHAPVPLSPYLGSRTWINIARFSCNSGAIWPCREVDSKQQQPGLGRQVRRQLLLGLLDGIPGYRDPQAVQGQEGLGLPGPVLVHAVDDDDGYVLDNPERRVGSRIGGTETVRMHLVTSLWLMWKVAALGWLVPVKLHSQSSGVE